MKVIVALGIIFCVIFVCSAAVSGLVQGVSQSTATPTATASVTSQRAVTIATNTPGAKVTPKPTATPATHYPPKTKADLQALAALGDVSAIHEFHSESVGAVGACPEPKRFVTVDPSITGKRLAEDLLAYFYDNQLDSPCGSLVGAFHTQAEANDVFTAGRILFDTTNQDGSANFDPNATGLKYTLTLNTGDALSAPDYVVTY